MKSTTAQPHGHHETLSQGIKDQRLNTTFPDTPTLPQTIPDQPRQNFNRRELRENWTLNASSMERLRTSNHAELPWTEEGPHDFVHIHLMTTPQLNNQDTPASPDELTMSEVHTFPKSLPDWSNLEVLHRNTLPPRATFHLYDNEADALTRDVKKSKTFSLSGTWKFNLAKSPFDAPPDFFEDRFDSRKWGTIEVPGIWQLQGYGKGPQYAFQLRPRTVADFLDIQI